MFSLHISVSAGVESALASERKKRKSDVVRSSKTTVDEGGGQHCEVSVGNFSNFPHQAVGVEGTVWCLSLVSSVNKATVIYSRTSGVICLSTCSL